MKHCAIFWVFAISMLVLTSGARAHSGEAERLDACELRGIKPLTVLRNVEEKEDLGLIVEESPLWISFKDDQFLVDRRVDRTLKHFLNDGFLLFYQEAFQLNRELREVQAPAQRKEKLEAFHKLLVQIGRYVAKRFPTDPERPHFWEARRQAKFAEIRARAENGLIQIGDFVKIKTADAFTRALFLELLLGQLCISAKLRVGSLEAPHSQTPFETRPFHAWVEFYDREFDSPTILDPTLGIYGDTFRAAALNAVRTPHFTALEYRVNLEDLRIAEIARSRN